MDLKLRTTSAEERANHMEWSITAGRWERRVVRAFGAYTGGQVSHSARGALADSVVPLHMRDGPALLMLTVAVPQGAKGGWCSHFRDIL